MNKEQLSIAMVGYKETFASMSMRREMTDERVRALYGKVARILEFVLAKKEEFEDYELSSLVSGICEPLNMLKREDVSDEEKSRIVEVIEVLVKSHEDGLLKCHGMAVELQEQREPIDAKKNVIPKPMEVPSLSETARVLDFSSYTVDGLKERLERTVDDLARDYMINRARLDKMGWENEDALYDRIVAWSGRATMGLKDNPSSVYYKKMAYNVSNLANLMSLLLGSNDNFSLVRHSKQLEQYLEQMDEHYGQSIKTM